MNMPMWKWLIFFCFLIVILTLSIFLVVGMYISSKKDKEKK